MSKAERPYAYDLLITRHDLTTETITRVAKNENHAKKIGLFRPRADKVEIIGTYTEAEYRRAHGHPHRGGREWG